MLCPHVQPELLATGGSDTTVQLFDMSRQRSLASLTGHSKRVTGVTWACGGAALLSASMDRTVRFWRPAGGDAAEGAWECGAVGSEHTGGVTGLTLHPSGAYAVSVSEDGSWAWWDAAEGTCLKQVCV